jgi:hypothetical protein
VVGLAVGVAAVVGVSVAGEGVGRLPHALNNMDASKKKKSFFRKGNLQDSVWVFYLKLKFQSAL